MISPLLWMDADCASNIFPLADRAVIKGEGYEDAGVRYIPGGRRRRW